MADNEVLERAALALANSQGGAISSLDELDDEFRAGLIEDVRAVLKAIREPSQAMRDAAFGSSEVRRPVQVWQDMIDKAVSER